MDFFIFLLGLCIGSFLNVVIHRLPLEQSIVTPRSHCPQCQTTLKWYNLIPVLSWIWQKAKCPYCGVKISPRYMMVEVITGLLFLTVYNYYGLSWETAGYLILISILVAISFIDLEHQIIPNQLIVFGIVIGVIFIINNHFLEHIVGFFLGGGLLLAIAILSRGSMGGGDIKLAAVMGLFLGWKLLLQALFWGFLLGSIVGGILLLLKQMKRKDPLPFGPFLALGSIITLFWGNSIATWYLNTFAGFGR